jgi:uncharacterized RDD family membrane protein YckC
MSKLTEIRHFHAHETARFDQLSGLPLASFKRRATAILIDFAIVAVLKSPFVIANALLRRHHSEQPVGWQEWLHQAVEKIKDIAESVLYFAVALKLGKGQTPGKWLMKIRVLSLSHQQLGWWQAIERALGYGASFLEGGFGFVQYFIHRNRMTVHDRIAETIVVDLRKKRLLHVEQAEPELTS